MAACSAPSGSSLYSETAARRDAGRKTFRSNIAISREVQLCDPKKANKKGCSLLDVSSLAHWLTAVRKDLTHIMIEA